MLLGADPAAHQVVAHRVGQREVVIAGGGDVAVLDEGEVEMAIEALAHLGHVPQPRDAPHADLLPTVPVAQRRRHPAAAAAAPPAPPLPPPQPGWGRAGAAAPAPPPPAARRGRQRCRGGPRGTGRATGDCGGRGAGVAPERLDGGVTDGTDGGRAGSSIPPPVRALALKGSSPPRSDFKLGVYCRHSEVQVSPRSRSLCHVLLH